MIFWSFMPLDSVERDRGRHSGQVGGEPLQTGSSRVAQQATGIKWAQQLHRLTFTHLLSPGFQIHWGYLITGDVVRGVFPKYERIQRNFSDFAVVTDQTWQSKLEKFCLLLLGKHTISFPPKPAKEQQTRLTEAFISHQRSNGSSLSTYLHHGALSSVFQSGKQREDRFLSRAAAVQRVRPETHRCCRDVCIDQIFS